MSNSNYLVFTSMNNRLHMWNTCAIYIMKSLYSLRSKVITNVKVIKVKLNKSQTWSVSCQDKFIYQISSQYHKRRERKVQETTFFAKGTNSIQSRSNATKVELDLYYVKSNSYMKFQVNVWQDGKGKSGNIILAKGNNSCKSRSNATKVKLDLYHVKTNSYTKCQVKITKDRGEKSGKLNICTGL